MKPLILRVLIRIRKFPDSLLRQGFFHTIHLISIYTIIPKIMLVLPRLLPIYKTNKKRMEEYFSLRRNISYWRQKKDEVLELGRSGHFTAIDEIGLSTEQCEKVRKLNKKSHEVLIAKIDQDGFMLSYFGAIRNSSLVSAENFLERKKFTLSLVALKENVGVKKDYQGNKLAFINEIRALHSLRLVGCNIPSIMNVDFDNLTLTISYVLGSVLRENLAKRGAILRDCDVENSPDSAYHDPKKKWLRRIQEGKKFLYEVVDWQFVESLFDEIRKIHSLGFLWNDIKYGNIIIEEKTGDPYLIDFDRTSHFPWLPKSLFRVLSDQEVELFNVHFDAQKCTYSRMKKEIESNKENRVYAPVYFGNGLRIGDLWKNKVGYGRWHYILKQNLPSLLGKRILDLGSNNAFNSIQMLRSGAKEVVGIELNEKSIKQSIFTKKGFEWIDNRKYSFINIHANMKDIIDMNLGRFDLILALCSLYYLDDATISNLVQYISTITDVFIVQCNIQMNIDRSDPHTYEKASVEYNMQLLKDNGFPFIRLIAPYRYSRPLLIARKVK